MAIAARRGRKRGLSWGITKAERDTSREMLKTLDLGVLPLVVPAVLLVVPDDLFDVPLLTGAVSPSALLEENPSPAMPGPLVAATRSVL